MSRNILVLSYALAYDALTMKFCPTSRPPREPSSPADLEKRPADLWPPRNLHLKAALVDEEANGTPRAALEHVDQGHLRQWRQVIHRLARVVGA